MGTNRDAQGASGSEGGSQNMRSQEVSNQGGGLDGEKGQRGADGVEVPEALSNLTERERAIFNAGMAMGAARMLSDVAEQHANFTNQARLQIATRHTQGLELLEKLPPHKSTGSLKGEEARRRIGSAVGALFGQK